MNKNAYQTMSSNEETFWWYVARRKVINKVIHALGLPTSNILEIGSGTGGNSAFLSALGQYTGVEKEKLAIELAEAKNNKAKFIQGNIPGHLTTIKEQYDLIALLDVLEHIEEDVDTLKKIKPLIKKGGSVVMTVPAHPFLWSYHDVAHHHFRRYTKTALLQAVEQAGLTVKYISYYNFLLYPLIRVGRWFFKLFKLRTTDDIPPNKISNHVLQWIFSLESKLLPKISFPTGVSLIIVLKK